MTEPALLTAAEAAAVLGRSVEWTRELLAEGAIEGARQRRGRWYVPRDALMTWIEGGEQREERGRVVTMPREVIGLGERRAV